MKLIITYFFFLVCSGCKNTDGNTINPRNNTLSSTATLYTLDLYKIDPKAKAVATFSYWEEDRGDIHAWGETWEIDTTINYDTTTLLVFDNSIVFSEHYNPIPFDAINEKEEPINLDEYKPQGDYYEKNGEYYHLISTGGSNKQMLRKIEIPSGVDFTSLIYAGAGYYYNKNTLYYLDIRSSEQLLRVASGRGVPVVKRTHCVYNSKAYLQTRELPCKPTELKEIDTELNGEDIMLVDKETIYVSINPEADIKVPGIGRWIQLSAREDFEVTDNCVYLYPNGKKSDNYKDILFWTPEGFIGTSANVPNRVKYDKVFIYDPEKHDYEELNPKEFRLYQPGFYTYKGKSYYASYLVEDEIDFPNLQYIKSWNGTRSYWLTDGKVLFNLDAVSIVEKRISFDPCISLSDVDKLRLVNENLLVDSVNFYTLEEKKIHIIPFDSLGLKVKINAKNKAYQID